MTEMRRITISIPNELDEKIIDLRKTDRFIRCSYAEITRQLIEAGASKMLQTEAAGPGPFAKPEARDSA